MRRLSLLLGVVLALAACSSEESDPDADRPSSTPAILIDTETPEPDPTTPVAGDVRLGIDLANGSEGEYLLHAPPAVERERPLPWCSSSTAAPEPARGVSYLSSSNHPSKN